MNIRPAMLPLVSGVSSLLHPLTVWRYRGQQVICPLCNGQFSTFKPYGTKLELARHHQLISLGYRQQAVCPGCGSQERDRAVALYLAGRMIWLRSQPRPLLHIAPEKALGRYLARLTKPRYVSAACQRIDITAIPHADDTFDVIVCNHVLEHIPDDRQALSELYRVLKPAGFAILQVPYARDLAETLESEVSKPVERLRHYGQPDHVRLYGLDYARRVRACGFELEETTMRQRFGYTRVSRSGLIAEEKLFVASKPVAV